MGIWLRRSCIPMSADDRSQPSCQADASGMIIGPSVHFGSPKQALTTWEDLSVTHSSTAWDMATSRDAVMKKKGKKSSPAPIENQTPIVSSIRVYDLGRIIVRELGIGEDVQYVVVGTDDEFVVRTHVRIWVRCLAGLAHGGDDAGEGGLGVGPSWIEIEPGKEAVLHRYGDSGVPSIAAIRTSAPGAPPPPPPPPRPPKLDFSLRGPAFSQPGGTAPGIGGEYRLTFAPNLPYTPPPPRPPKIDALVTAGQALRVVIEVGPSPA